MSRLDTEQHIPQLTDKDLIFLLDKIKRNRDIDFRGYQTQTLKNRIHARLSATNCQNYWDYILLLNKEPQEYDRLISSLTIKVSEFFRDPGCFEILETCVIPEIVSRKEQQPGKRIRVWSCGAAFGQEAYSLAILFCEILGHRLKNYDIRILATDIDQEALEKARWSAYPRKALANMETHLLFKYFTRAGDDYAASDKLRNLVSFECHDITSNSQKAGMDLILCRNLLIYFQKGLQEEVLNSLHAALNPGGFLVLGKAENLSPGMVNRYFEVVDVGERVYQRVIGDR